MTLTSTLKPEESCGSGILIHLISTVTAQLLFWWRVHGDGSDCKTEADLAAIAITVHTGIAHFYVHIMITFWG